MTSGRPTENALPRRTLAQAARSGASGALHVDGSPGGTLFLAHGSVTYAESPAAPGVGELLTASGRLSRNTWRACFDAGRDEYRVGHVLVEQGHLTAGELELCVLGATYDAAFFVLQPRPAPVRFVAGERHWLGTLTQVDVTALDRETTRRHRLLDEITPESAVDGAPVTPVTRPPVDRVVLMALQWELLMHADGRRTPADLARLLGRAATPRYWSCGGWRPPDCCWFPVPSRSAPRRPSTRTAPAGPGPSARSRGRIAPLRNRIARLRSWTARPRNRIARSRGRVIPTPSRMAPHGCPAADPVPLSPMIARTSSPTPYGQDPTTRCWGAFMVP